MVNKLVTVDIDDKEIGKFLSPVYDTLAELTKEDLIQRFVSIEFNRFLNYYKDSSDINTSASQNDSGKHSQNQDRAQNRFRSGNLKRFFMNAGSMDNIKKGSIVRVLCDRSGISSKKIGPIEIMREFSFFEIDKSVAGKVLKSMKGAKIDGRNIRIQYADEKSRKKKGPAK